MQGVPSETSDHIWLHNEKIIYIKKIVIADCHGGIYIYTRVYIFILAVVVNTYLL